MAAQRARKIGSGSPLLIERDNDKNPVVALREIAGEKISTDDLKEELIRSNQRMVAFEEEDEDIDLMDGEQEWSTMAEEAQKSGMYADEEVAEESSTSPSEEPSLEDLAGA